MYDEAHAVETEGSHVPPLARRTVVMAVCQDPKDPKGGELVAVLVLCRGLIEAGFDVFLLTPCLDDQPPAAYTRCDGQLQVVRLRGAVTGPGMYGLDLRSRRARDAFADKVVNYVGEHFEPRQVVVHLQGGFPELPGRARELRSRGFRVVSTFHMLASDRAEALGEPGAVVGRLRRDEAEAVEANSAIITHSRRMADSVHRISPGYRGAIHVVPVGIDDDNFAAAPADPADRCYVTAYGRISPEKGFDLHVAAGRIVTERRRRLGLPPVKWLLFGKTDESIASRRQYARELERLAAGCEEIDLRLSAEGIWHEQRIGLLDRSLVGVVPSRYEPWGCVQAEMMARGLPVVSTVTHGAREMHGTGRAGPTPYGMLVETSAEAVAEAVEHLLGHRGLAERMARSAADKARRDFRAATFARATKEVYERSVASGRWERRYATAR